MMKVTYVLLALLALTGCASDDYRQYAETQKSIVNARAMTEAARYQALAEIAKTGDSTAKAAAIVGLSAQTPQPAQPVAEPKHEWWPFK